MSINSINKEIVQKDVPVLREIAQEVPQQEITSPRIQKIIKKMSKVLAEEEDGVGLAAPQIGESLRMFIVSGKALWYMDHEEHEEKPKVYPPDLVFINPVLVSVSKKTTLVDEGCLSVRYYYGKIRRAEKARIQAYNEQGKKFERGGSGLMAQIFQHEVDHLNGILFIDSACELEYFTPEKLESKKSTQK